MCSEKWVMFKNVDVPVATKTNYLIAVCSITSTYISLHMLYSQYTDADASIYCVLEVTTPIDN